MNDGEKIRAHCWSSSGLWGDSTCPELKDRVTCLNCPVYAEASRKLYGRWLPADTQQFWGRPIRPEPEVENGAGFLIFTCAGTHFALAADAIAEISGRRTPHRIPYRTNSAIEGIVNINGELVAAVSVSRLLGMPDTPPAADEKNAAMVLCSGKSGRFAVGADSLSGVKYFPEGAGSPPGGGESSFVEKVFNAGGGAVKLLDFELLAEAVSKG